MRKLRIAHTDCKLNPQASSVCLRASSDPNQLTAEALQSSEQPSVTKEPMGTICVNTNSIRSHKHSS